MRAALVAKVLSESPAERAGLRVGDVVVAFNGQAINRSSDLPQVVGRTAANGQVPVKIVRDGKLQSVQVVVGELPEESTVWRKPTPAAPAKNLTNNVLGLVVRNLTAEQRARYGLPEHGVLVERVEPRPASQGGIWAGDILLLLDGVEVTDSNKFERLALGLPAGKAVAALVQRGRYPVFLALTRP